MVEVVVVDCGGSIAPGLPKLLPDTPSLALICIKAFGKIPQPCLYLKTTKDLIPIKEPELRRG